MKEKELDKLDKAPMYRDKNFPSESEPTSSSGTGKDRRLDFGPIGFFRLSGGEADIDRVPR